MKIIIYGLGQNGKEFIQDIREVLKNIEIIAVTDSYIKKTEQKVENNIPYIKPCCIQNYIFDYIVITPTRYYDEIKEQLCLWGVDEYKIKTVQEIKETQKDIYCELCDSYPGVWSYIGRDYNIFHHKNIIGASKRRGNCPICGSSDRERFVYHVIRNYTDLLDGKVHSVLHFAPEFMLSEKIRKVCKEEYVTADIVPGIGDVVADIRSLQFVDEQFEYIICNHVMEHIIEEQKAFFELKRCLKTEGTFILTVPICWEGKTYENYTIKTEDERIKYYGQADHVRLYGNDIIERIEKFGFRVSLYICEKIVDKQSRKKFGYMPKDAVLLCRKNSKYIQTNNNKISIYR